jgi:hypothetical protein
LSVKTQNTRSSNTPGASLTGNQSAPLPLLGASRPSAPTVDQPTLLCGAVVSTTSPIVTLGASIANWYVSRDLPVSIPLTFSHSTSVLVPRTCATPRVKAGPTARLRVNSSSSCNGSRRQQRGSWRYERRRDQRDPC